MTVKRLCGTYPDKEQIDLDQGHGQVPHHQSSETAKSHKIKVVNDG